MEEYEERCNTKTRRYIRRGKKRNRKCKSAGKQKGELGKTKDKLNGGKFVAVS